MCRRSLLLLYIVAFPLLVRAVAEVNESLEDDLKEAIYRRCWRNCEQKFQNGTASYDAVLSLINDKFDLDRHEEHCSSYNSSKICAQACLVSPSHDFYLRPFHRRNYLNDFICVRHYDEFRRFLPCYQNHRSLELFFTKCGYFALDEQNVLQANQETCSALRCVRRLIPDLIRTECASGNADLALGAGNLMEKMVTAFLRERVRLNKMLRACDAAGYDTV